MCLIKFVYFTGFSTIRKAFLLQNDKISKKTSTKEVLQVLYRQKEIMNSTFKQLNITSKPSTRRGLAVNMREAGGRQGRLSGYRKANAPLTRLMNLAWGL